MSNLSVSRVVDFPRRNTERAAPEIELEDVADERLWKARLGVPGIYVVYPAMHEIVYIRVTSFFDYRRGRMVIRVYPYSRWKDGDHIVTVSLPEQGERKPFLPSCVLWGKCDYDRLPKEHNEMLSGWADIILDGVDYYDEMHPRRSRPTRAN